MTLIRKFLHLLLLRLLLKGIKNALNELKECDRIAAWPAIDFLISFEIFLVRFAH